MFPNTNLKVGAMAADRLEIENGGVLFFTGRGSSITGRGGDILLLDDPIKDRKEANSPTIRGQLWDWFKQVLSTRLMTQMGAIIIIMTRWHDDDIVGRLTDPYNPFYSEDEAAAWRIIDLPAEQVSTIFLDANPAKPSGRNASTKNYLAIQKRSDPRGFSALYGRPSPEDGSFFQRNHFTPYNKMSDLPPIETLRFYAASDHAVTMDQNNDKTCCLIAGVDSHDDIWIMPDVFWQRATTDIVVERMVLLMEKYKPVYWWAERGQITKSIGPFLRKRMIEKNVFCAIDEIVPIADKQSRAQAIMARMSMGRVHFPSFARWYGEAQDQMLKFPQGVHDDFVDSLAYIGLGLGKQVPKRAVRPAAKEAGFGTLGWIKNSTRRTEREQAANRR